MFAPRNNVSRVSFAEMQVMSQCGAGSEVVMVEFMIGANEGDDFEFQLSRYLSLVADLAFLGGFAVPVNAPHPASADTQSIEAAYNEIMGRAH